MMYVTWLKDKLKGCSYDEVTSIENYSYSYSRMQTNLTECTDLIWLWLIDGSKQISYKNDNNSLEQYLQTPNLNLVMLTQ